MWKTYLPDDQLDKQVTAIRDQLAIDFEGQNADVEVVVGHSAQTILDWAKRNEIDCIIVASHRPGLQDYFLGSTAGRVVRHATCPVVVMR